MTQANNPNAIGSTVPIWAGGGGGGGTITGAANVGAGTGEVFRDITLGTTINLRTLSSTGDASNMLLIATAGDLVTFALQNQIVNTTTRNTFFGPSSGNTTATGVDNVALGNGALSSVTFGPRNIAIGTSALTTLAGGIGNTAIGEQAGDALASGSRNVFIGPDSGTTLLSGSDNIGIGERTLQDQSGNTTGNVAVGSQAGQNLTTATGMTLIGRQAGNQLTGSSNTAVGHQAMFGTAASTGEQNTAMGDQALNVVSSGSDNVALGFNAMLVATTAADNTIIGSSAGNTLTTGARNILIGTNIQTPAVGTNDHLSINDLLFGDLSAGGGIRIGGSGAVSQTERLAVTQATADTSEVLSIETTGLNGKQVAFFVGDQDPNGTVTGSSGDLYVQNDGTGSALWQNVNAGTGTTWQQLNAGAIEAESALFGLTMSKTGNSEITVEAGFIRDTTDADTLVLSSSATVDLTVASSAGGRDQAGSFTTNTMIYIWVIGGGGNTVDVIASASSSAPTLPGSYTLFAFIGSVGMGGTTDEMRDWTQSGTGRTRRVQYEFARDEITVIGGIPSGTGGLDTVSTSSSWRNIVSGGTNVNFDPDTRIPARPAGAGGVNSEGGIVVIWQIFVEGSSDNWIEFARAHGAAQSPTSSPSNADGYRVNIPDRQTNYLMEHPVGDGQSLQYRTAAADNYAFIIRGYYDEL